MKITSQRIASLLILTFMAEMLIGCSSTPTTVFDVSSTPGPAKPAPEMIESPNPAYADAQATIDYGKIQLLDLSRKETETSLNLSQDANAAALSTQDYNQRQKIDLAYQATVVSLNIAQAAATQKFMSEQTKSAGDAIAAAQSGADAATQSAYAVNVTQTAQAQAIMDAYVLQTAQAEAALTAYPLTATYSAQLLNVTETAQAQVILNAQAMQAAQAIATLTAYPLTATPFAVTQAALLMQQYNREQQSFVNEIVVPLLPILAAVVLVLFILVIVLANRRFIQMPWRRRLRFARLNGNPNPLIMIDGVIADPDPRLHPTIPSEPTPANPPRLESENTVHVEIVNPTEPPVAHWIAEVEHKLDTEGGLRL
jgi:hypothetical protein